MDAWNINIDIKYVSTKILRHELDVTQGQFLAE